MKNILFNDGHSWEVNTCKNCGMVRKSITVNSIPKKSRVGYSKDNFKTIDFYSGVCFVNEERKCAMTWTK
jgi:hypothetical protein